MWLSLIGTAFFMGLVGGPHCLAMCAAPCATVVSRGEHKLEFYRHRPIGRTTQFQDPHRWLALHLGRLMGYAALGGLAGYAMETVAWFSDGTSALRPLWISMHLASLAWGLVLLFQVKQPGWVEGAGRILWSRISPLLHRSGFVWLVGFLWVLLPCGLLYSALMVAALGGGGTQGAAVMAAFGLGSGMWLVIGPWIWGRLKYLKAWRDDWGLRIAGGLLVAISLAALWLNLIHAPAQWCR